MTANKMELYVWACAVLRQHVDSDAFGTVTFSFANGRVGSAKEEIHRKPPEKTPDARIDASVKA